MSDEPEVPTVRSRLLSGGISEERLAMHHEARRVLLNGVIVDDLDQPAPPGTRLTFAGT